MDARTANYCWSERCHFEPGSVVIRVLIVACFVGIGFSGNPAQAVKNIQFVVVSVPHLGNDGNNNWNVEVMDKFKKMALTLNNLSLAYDWEGSSNTHSSDGTIWNELFGHCVTADPSTTSVGDCSKDKKCPEGCKKVEPLSTRWINSESATRQKLSEEVKTIVMKTRWWFSYRGMIKNALRLAAQIGCAPNTAQRDECPTVYVVQIKGGPITTVEQADMTNIINETKMDLAKLGYNNSIFLPKLYDTWDEFMGHVRTIKNRQYYSKRKIEQTINVNP